MDRRTPGFFRVCWIYVCAAFFCGSLIVASAENSAKDEPPKPPFVTMPPPGSQWEMVITHDPQVQNRIDSATNAVKSGDHTAVIPSLPISVHVNNGLNGIIESTVRYANNRVDVYYFYKGKLLIKAVNSDRIYVITPPSEDLSSINGYDLKQPIPGVLWITEKYYQGKETVKTPCHVYRVKGLSSTRLGADFELAAWVSVETGFPVKVQIGKTFYNYSAVRKYPENVRLPDAYLAEFKKNFGE